MKRTVFLAVALGVMCSVAALPAAPRQQTGVTDLDPVSLLELYDAGRFDEAIARVKAAGDQAARTLRRRLRTEGSEWIDVERPNHAHRLLVVAAFTLETEVLRVERGEWGTSQRISRVINLRPNTSRPLPFTLPSVGCESLCMLEWAQLLLIERGLFDTASRSWFHGAIALAEGREWSSVYTLLGPEAPAPARGLAYDAISAFPDEPWFQFDRALALAARYNVTRDGIAPGSSVIIPAPPKPPQATTYQSGNRTVTRIRLGGGGAPERGTANLPPVQPVSALDELTRLSADPVVGIDAQIRLGYLQWATGSWDAAVSSLNAAAAAATDADRRYLAHFLAGWIRLRGGQDDAARQSLLAALDARPNSQSATVALASLELRHGDADAAHARAAAALAERATDDDPWREFLYGRHPMLPRLIADLREAVRR